MKQPDADSATELLRAVGEKHQSYRGRQRKAGPRRKTAAIAGAHQTDGKPDLAASGAGQELTQTHEIGIGLLVEPAAAHDELVAEVPDVSYRAAETGNALPEEHQHNFAGRTCRPVCGLGRVAGDRHSDAPDRLGVVEERRKPKSMCNCR